MLQKINPNLPTICAVSYISCPRVFKESFILTQRGYKVHLVSMNVPAGYHIYHTINLYPPLDQPNPRHTRERLRNAVRNINADIYHCHNEPSWLVNVVKEAVPDKKVIFDVHDTDRMRYGWNTIEEQMAFDTADGVVHVSEEIGKKINEYYGYKGPWAHVNSCVPFVYYVTPVRYGSGVVYEGGIHTPSMMKGDNKKYAYRDFTDIFRRFLRQGYQVHTWTGVDSIKPYLNGLGCTVHDKVPMDELIATMPQFGRWGLALFVNKSEHIANAMPNKIFEYMAAGIPVVANKGTVFGNFVEKNGVGVTMHEDDIPDLPDPFPYIENVMKVRENYTMEKEVDKLEALYSSVMESPVKSTMLPNPTYGELLEALDDNAKILQNYSFDQYLSLVTRIKLHLASDPQPLKRFNKDSKFYIRHDVDMNLLNAIKLAEKEKENGIYSSYYFLHTADYWNGGISSHIENNQLFAEIVYHGAALAEFKKVQDMGHEVGLHNDILSQYMILHEAGFPNQNWKAILEEILKSMRDAGLKITGTASHGGPYCYKYGFVNYNIFNVDKATGISKPNNVDKQAVFKSEITMPWNGLKYEAYELAARNKIEWYIADSNGRWKIDHFGSNWKRDMTIHEVIDLIPELSKGTVMLVTHPEYCA